MNETLALPPCTDFAAVFDAGRYTPIPDSWFVAVSDVVNSTVAIKAGRYKDVNLAGAAMIAAVLNACGRDDLPFSFGGDGGIVLVGPEFESVSRAALSGVKRMCADILDLELRCSLIPATALKKAGQEIHVTNFDLGSGRTLAMLAGGGVEAAERLCKSPEGAAYAIRESVGECDLSGLSCRWEPLKPAGGAVLSILVQAWEKEGVLPSIYRDIYARIDGLLGNGAAPAKRTALSARWFPAGIRREFAFPRPDAGFLRRLRILLEVIVTKASLVFGRPLLGFDAEGYANSIDRHSDHRKYADSLRMVVDCTQAQAETIRDILEAEWAKGSIEYGTHLASEALMTCFMHGTGESEHVHFIDGADGGYALAALEMKRRARPQRPT